MHALVLATFACLLVHGRTLAQEGYCFREHQPGPIATRGRCQGRVQEAVSSAAQCCQLGGVGWSEKSNGKRCVDACQGVVPGATEDGQQAMGPPGVPREGTTVEEAIANGGVPGVWGEWSFWQPCSVTCGTGFRERRRDCNPPNASVEDGFQCSGDRVEHVVCDTKNVCPVHGEWGQWSDWSECSATCGDTSARHRSCDSPPPGEGGNRCVGEDTEVQWCNQIKNCPIDGSWEAWSHWSPCSKTCGRQGQRERFRSCTNPAPRHGGANCIGDLLDQRPCTPQPYQCPVDGGWSDWAAWRCQSSCAGGGEGFAYRERQCSNPKPKNRGRYCRGDAAETTPCRNVECPVDGGWSKWSSWDSECSSTCGEGSFRQRRRSCDNPAPSLGGLRCIGPEVDHQMCAVDACPDTHEDSSSEPDESATGVPCDDEDYDNGRGSGCRTEASGEGASEWPSDGSSDVIDSEPPPSSSSFENHSPEYYTY